ncbi:MAG TPA: HAD hydrolase family protein [Pseudoxanthomonas sp.]|nr:HAD hydrolase family protein [Pseudoxanthomonas sp.]
MEYSPASTVSADVLQRAIAVRLACFDVDGTLTDGRLHFDDAGGEAKAFHVSDGQGLVLLRRHGIEVAFITARHGQAAERRAAELGIQMFAGAKDKLAQVQRLCEECGLGLEQAAFMGDDLPDLRVMARVGLAVAPANAHPWIVAQAHWRTARAGGEGAARELCDLLLDAQGHFDALLQEWGA